MSVETSIAWREVFMNNKFKLTKALKRRIKNDLSLPDTLVVQSLLEGLDELINQGSPKLIPIIVKYSDIFDGKYLKEISDENSFQRKEETISKPVHHKKVKLKRFM